MKKDDLPNIISIFPLSNAIFFPRTVLPLNIFEKRYIQLVEDSMKDNRIFGMVQPKTKIGTTPEVYNVGCLGKITNFSETNDGRFIITLSGVIRFRIKKEIERKKMYRSFEVNYSDFLNDLKIENKNQINIEKKDLLNKVKKFFNKINYPIDHDELSKLNLDQLISTVSMISPFSVEEKQKLIETIKIDNKVKILKEIINFNLLDYEQNKTIQQ